MLVFCVRIEVMGSLWWLVREIGLGFGPAHRAGPEGPWPQGRRPWGRVLVFCVRIEVMGSVWWLVRDIGFGFGPAHRAGPEGPWPQGPKGPGAEC